MIHIKHVFIIIFALLLISIAWENLFSSEIVSGEFTVLSQYESTETKQSPRLKRWTIFIDEAETGSKTLAFYPYRPRAVKPFCTIALDAARPDGSIVWHGNTKSRTKTTSNGVMVLPGYPIPCDIIPPNRGTEDFSFYDRVTAADRVFVKQYHLSYRMVHQDEAMKEGWIKESAPPSSSLEMRTVVDDEGNLIVRQLWPESGLWWVYEETPYRRSWVVGE